MRIDLRRCKGIEIDAKAHKFRKMMLGLDQIIQHGTKDRYCLAVTQKVCVKTQTFKFGYFVVHDV